MAKLALKNRMDSTTFHLGPLKNVRSRFPAARISLNSRVHAIKLGVNAPFVRPQPLFSLSASITPHAYFLRTKIQLGAAAMDHLHGSPKPGALLKKVVSAWSQETGSPTSVSVRIHCNTFHLHKLPLISKSGYFKKALNSSADVQLPLGFPGGPEMFEAVALFLYESPLPLDPFNVSALRCAAELLEMTDDYAPRNLCNAADLYLNQVVLQSWDDTLIALQTCQPLLRPAEELLIVSRCVESLAFMACMEILDPDRRHRSTRRSNTEVVKAAAATTTASQEMWVKDLIALPSDFFARIVRSLRRQGVKEKYVTPIVICYANKWVLSEKTRKFWEEEADGGAANGKVSTILQSILDLLPLGNSDKDQTAPVTFYLALLSTSLSLKLGDGIRLKLEQHVVQLLHLAQVEDFLPEVETMERIVSIRVASKREFGFDACVVAELWDMYLCRIANDPKLTPPRFTELVESVPMADRETHDHLYRAIHTFLSSHPQISSEDKTKICSKISCQRLSQEACIQAVQDELMPLRLIIQALFVQQLYTQQAFKDCSESFRNMPYGEFSGSISSSACHLPKSQNNLDEGPCDRPSVAEETASAVPLGSLLKKHRMIPKSLRNNEAAEEYQTTRYRIQALERELASLKQCLRSNETTKTAAVEADLRLISTESDAFMRRHGCISSLSWSSQRKHADRLLKVLRRVAMLGKGK